MGINNFEDPMKTGMGRRDFLKLMGASTAGLALTGSIFDGALLSGNPAETGGGYGVDIKRVFIPMPDGVRIAATMYLPKTKSSGEKFPAIIEVLPYRKDDDFVERDFEVYHWFASHGYIGCRVDVRGTGGSYGKIFDEYTEQEHRDTVQAIKWLSRHPLCTGNVGMWGISYGGFNSLQVASLMQPPELKAIVSMYASDDRYTDDVHYYGGCLHAFENIWAVGMEAENAFPSYPDYSPTDPRTIDRFSIEPWMFRWLWNQTDNSYWRYGSLRPDYNSIKIPAYLIGGWLDGYVNAVPRIMQSIKSPAKGMIGPWPHTWPDDKGPWVRIDWLRELKRWWDRWLKNEQNGIMKEPPLSVFIRDSYPPSNYRLKGVKIPGRWAFIDKWPPDDIEERHLFADAKGELQNKETSSGELKLVYRPTIGVTGKTWAPNGDGSYGVDQRGDDAFCLIFTTEPLSEPLEILGFPEAQLWVKSPVTRINWIVRLNDIFPDGTSQFVSRGVLNATHRNSHVNPIPVVPGEIYKMKIPMQAVSWVFPKGHRIRFSISNGEWPIVWPSPYPAVNSVFTGGDTPTGIILPVRHAKKEKTPQFHPPEEGRKTGPFKSIGEESSWVVQRDEGNLSTRLCFQDEYGTNMLNDGIVFMNKRKVEISASDNDPAKAFLGGWSVMSVEGKKKVSVKADVSLKSDADHFHLEVQRVLREGSKKMMERKWKESIPRKFI